MKTIKLNMGCGNKHKEGYLNIDLSPSVKPDMLLDLGKFPYPFKDNSVSAIYSEDLLEHFPKHDLFKVLEEWHRISKPGAIWELKLPFYNSSSIAHVQHYSVFDFSSFDTMDVRHKYHYYWDNLHFKIIKIDHIPTTRGRLVPFRKFFSRSIGQIVRSVIFTMEVVKK